MKKKIILSLCLVAIATLLFALTANAAEPVETWNVSATSSDNVTAYVYADPNNSGMYTLTISGTGNMMDLAYWYSYYSTITSVTIEQGVTSIGDYAFAWCPNLTSIVIPESVTYIGDYAFESCSSLASVVVPKSTTYIGDYAFECCNNLASIVILADVSFIGDYTFFGCIGITSIIIPNSVISIGKGAFECCASLTSIIIPENVTSIGDSAFAVCESLTSAVIPEGVTSIGSYAFDYCSKLTIYCEAPSQPSGWDSDWNSSSCPVVWGYFDETACLSDIFTFKGYSFSIFGSMAIGFTYNDEAVATYEAKTGKALEIGVVFALFDTLNGKTPLDESGEAREVDGGVVIKGDLTGTDSKHFDFVLTDIDEASRDVKLVISAYIYTGDAVYYVQGNGLSNTVYGISFNEAMQ